jgi:hypothetical protein
MTHYTTNNPVRDEHIEAAIAVVRRHGLDVTVATMTDCLPEGFELDAAELSGILSNEAPPAEPEPVEPRPGYDAIHRDPLIRRRATPPAPPASAPPHIQAEELEKAPKAIKLDFNQSVERLKELQSRLFEHRREVMALTRLALEKRGKLAEAIQAFQAGAVEGNVERRRMAEVRDHLAASAAERARRMEQIPLELRGKYGTAAQFVRKQRMVPAVYDKQGRAIPGDPRTLRKGESRGAAPASMRVLPGVKV